MPKLIPPVVPPGTMATAEQPEIAVDDNLLLRPFRESDTAAVVAAFGDPDIQHWHFRRFDTDAEALGWIREGLDAWRAERSATWAVVERADGRIAGRVSIHLRLEDGHGEVAYWLLPWARGQGVATRACVAATRWAHDLGLHRVQLEHSTRNDASRRVAERAGFTVEGCRRGANLHDDGWHDMQLWSHLSTDVRRG